jgi:hypothetical protein
MYVCVGTASDKLASWSMLVQQYPLQQLESLDALLSVAGKKASRSPRQDALETLKELFLHHLLPDRKLIPFDLRPFEEQTDRKLLMWYFEDELKTVGMGFCVVYLFVSRIACVASCAVCWVCLCLVCF